MISHTSISSLNTSTLSHLDTMVSRHPILEPLRQPLLDAVAVLCAAHHSGNQVLVCGNGGSAADAEHIVGELVKQFRLPRHLPPTDAARLSTLDPTLAPKLQRGVRAISLVSQSALTTAVANDTDATMIFAQQVYVYAKPGDVVIGISTSGNSGNVVKALQVGKAFGLTTIGLTGERVCKMDSCCDILLKAPASETSEVQEFHLPIYHAICLMVEEQLFGEASPGEAT